MPVKKKLVSYRLDPDIIELLKKLAKKYDVTDTHIISILVKRQADRESIQLDVKRPDLS